MDHEPTKILAQFKSQEPLELDKLPNQHGIYSLHDHAGEIRYIGVTHSLNMGFRKRIWSYHVAGSEDYSHKFS